MAKAFVFTGEAHLVRFTGWRADNVRDLMRGLSRAGGASIFFHTWHALFRRHILQGEFVNDFARWVRETLREEVLAERLAAVDPLDFESMSDARARLVEIMEDHLGRAQFLPHCAHGQEFLFQEVTTFTFPVGASATTLAELERHVRVARPDVVFHHLLAARARLGGQDNDFSRWVREELGDRPLADSLRALSPYRWNLLTVRGAIGDLVRDELEARA